VCLPIRRRERLAEGPGNLSSSLLFGTLPLADPFALLQVLATGTMVAAKALLGAGIVLFFFAVVAGRAFCGWICPVNIVTDLAGTVSTVVGVGTRPLRMSRNARYWVLGLSLILSAWFGITAFEWISPIGALHGVIFRHGNGLSVTGCSCSMCSGQERFAALRPLGAFYSPGAGAVRVVHSNDSTQPYAD
jgi:ferredoxin-type protein NapH